MRTTNAHHGFVRLTPHTKEILWNVLCVLAAGGAAILVLLMLAKDQRRADLRPAQHNIHRIAPRGCGLIALRGEISPS